MWPSASYLVSLCLSSPSINRKNNTFMLPPFFCHFYFDWKFLGPKTVYHNVSIQHLAQLGLMFAGACRCYCNTIRFYTSKQNLIPLHCHSKLLQVFNDTAQFQILLHLSLLELKQIICSPRLIWIAKPKLTSHPINANNMIDSSFTWFIHSQKNHAWILLASVWIP